VIYHWTQVTGHCNCTNLRLTCRQTHGVSKNKVPRIHLTTAKKMDVGGWILNPKRLNLCTGWNYVKGFMSWLRPPRKDTDIQNLKIYVIDSLTQFFII